MEELRPSNPALSPYVESFWFLKSGTAHEPYLLPPDPNGTLIFSFDSGTTVRAGSGETYNLSGHFCTGLRSFPVTLDPRGPVDYIAVQLKPNALRTLLGIHAGEVSDYLVELDDIGPAFSREVSENLAKAHPGKLRPATPEAVRTIEATLLDRLLRPELEPPHYLGKAIERIVTSSGKLTVRSLCDDVGITARQLEREFDRWVGQSAKLFSRIVRMNTALSILQGGAPRMDLADLALTLGYYDQSHLCGEFAELVGISPKEIIRMTTEST
jgi:AraC-like DNA-binding protein